MVRLEDRDGLVKGVAVAEKLLQVHRHRSESLRHLGMTPLPPEMVLEVAHLVLDDDGQVALEGALALELAEDGVVVRHYLVLDFGQEVFGIFPWEVTSMTGVGDHFLDVGEVGEEDLFGGH